jgi:hypothetical protein
VAGDFQAAGLNVAGLNVAGLNVAGLNDYYPSKNGVVKKPQ